MLRLRSCIAIALCASAVSVLAQARQKRITVMPFKDRTGSPASFNISEKVADAILAKLAETGQFIVVERESLAALQSEKNLKFDADFNPQNAPKSGMLAVCDIVITGQIDEFSANQTSSAKKMYVATKTRTDGTTALKITTRVTSVETGQILGAPSARSEKEGLLGESNSTPFIPNVGNDQSTANTNSALVKLVDANIEVVAEDVAKKIAASPAVAATPAAAPPAVLPKFVGIDNGLVMINKGATAGIKVGDAFEVVHPVDTGFKDPDTGAAIVKKSKLCTLVISTVDDTTSEGKCDGGTPTKGDEIRAVPK
jgi:curli biogenesis system outer membrane secretion channel CsgG